jgi:hypothetical protein
MVAVGKSLFISIEFRTEYKEKPKTTVESKMQVEANKGLPWKSFERPIPNPTHANSREAIDTLKLIIEK